MKKKLFSFIVVLSATILSAQQFEYFRDAPPTFIHPNIKSLPNGIRALVSDGKIYFRDDNDEKWNHHLVATLSFGPYLRTNLDGSTIYSPVPSHGVRSFFDFSDSQNFSDFGFTIDQPASSQTATGIAPKDIIADHRFALLLMGNKIYVEDLNIGFGCPNSIPTIMLDDLYITGDVVVPSTMYIIASANGKVMRSSNITNWQLVSNDGFAYKKVRTGFNSTIFAISNTEIRSSVDSGSTWTSFTQNGIPDQTFNYLDYHQASGTLYVSGSKGLYSIKQNETSWTDESFNVSNTDVICSNRLNNTLFCTTASGVMSYSVLKRELGSQIWQQYEDGTGSTNLTKILFTANNEMVPYNSTNYTAKDYNQVSWKKYKLTSGQYDLPYTQNFQRIFTYFDGSVIRKTTDFENIETIHTIPDSYLRKELNYHSNGTIVYSQKSSFYDPYDLRIFNPNTNTWFIQTLQQSQKFYNTSFILNNGVIYLAENGYTQSGLTYSPNTNLRYFRKTSDFGNTFSTYIPDNTLFLPSFTDGEKIYGIDKKRYYATDSENIVIYNSLNNTVTTILVPSNYYFIPHLSRGNTLYCYTNSPTGGYPNKILKSTNLGASWTEIQLPVANCYYTYGIDNNDVIYVQAFDRQQINAIYKLNVNLGLEEVTKNSSLTIYPNPVRDKLIIKAQEEFNSVSVYNMTGQLILQKEFSKTNELQLDATELTKGIYIVNVSGDKVKLSSKIVKE